MRRVGLVRAGTPSGSAASWSGTARPGLALRGVLVVIAALLLAGCGSGAKQAAPSAPAFSGLTVFGGPLAAGWTDASWNSVTRLSVAAPGAQGARALSLSVVKPWGGLYFRSQDGIDVAPYGALRFAAQASADAPRPTRFAVWLTDPRGDQLSPPQSLDGYGGQPVSGAWRQYAIPLRDLDAAGKMIGGIILQDTSGALPPPLYLDAIFFSTATADATSPTPSAPSVATASSVSPLALPPSNSPTPTALPTAPPSATQSALPSATAASPSPATSGTSRAVGSPTPAATPPAAGSTSPLPIFVGGLANGWGDASFGATVDESVASPTYSGGPVIGVRYTQATGALVLRSDTPIDVGGYATVRFAAQSAALGSNVELRLADASGRPIGTALLLSDYGGQPVPDAWTVYRIPVAAFAAAGQPVSELIVQAVSGASQPELFLDSITLQ